MAERKKPGVSVVKPEAGVSSGSPDGKGSAAPLAPYKMQESRPFRVESDFSPQGDQPEAIKALVSGVQAGKRQQVLLGVTGSGKTFTMAQVLAQVGRPTLVMAPNKTLAAQLYSEFKAFFPDNAVEYFVSYYDYYQPEAFIPSTNTYIEKDSAINDEIDKLRHSATRSLLDRNDVIIVSSVSCIYGLGSPEAYEGMLLYLEEGKKHPRQEVLNKLVEIQYERHDVDFHRGRFRVRGDVIDIFPSYEEEKAVRIELFGDEIEAIYEIDGLRGVKVKRLGRTTIYPASHYVTDFSTRTRAIEAIREELRERLQQLQRENRLQEAKRLEQRTLFDLEMIEEIGYCQGIENYSRHMTGQKAGEPPPTLLDYFPKDFLLIIDESHVTVPQIGGMFRGDRARKQTLVDHGFRLPSALDNRPLNFPEFEGKMGVTIHVSATPGEYELAASGGEVVEQVIRPTGLLDPVVEVRPAQNQVEDLYASLTKALREGGRVLVTTLTKKLAEELTKYFLSKGVKVKYLHSDIETLERIEILRQLRQGVIEVLIGINLLREGLDLPEVSLVAILDADKEGFLRSHRSLIQTMGRAARNAQGLVVLYADRVTESMRTAMEETARRRQIQEKFNQEHGIVPRTVHKAVRAPLVFSDGLVPQALSSGGGSLGEQGSTASLASLAAGVSGGLEGDPKEWLRYLGLSSMPKDLKGFHDVLEEWTAAMKQAAKDLDFASAAQWRDRIRVFKSLYLSLQKSQSDL